MKCLWHISVCGEHRLVEYCRGEGGGRKERVGKMVCHTHIKCLPTYHMICLDLQLLHLTTVIDHSQYQKQREKVKIA